MSGRGRDAETTPRARAMLMVTCPTCGGAEAVRIDAQAAGWAAGWRATCDACGGGWDLEG